MKSWELERFVARLLWFRTTDDSGTQIRSDMSYQNGMRADIFIYRCKVETRYKSLKPCIILPAFPAMTIVKRAMVFNDLSLRMPAAFRSE